MDGSIKRQKGGRLGGRVLHYMARDGWLLKCQGSCAALIQMRRRLRVSWALSTHGHKVQQSKAITTGKHVWLPPRCTSNRHATGAGRQFVSAAAWELTVAFWHFKATLLKLRKRQLNLNKCDSGVRVQPLGFNQGGSNDVCLSFTAGFN